MDNQEEPKEPTILTLLGAKKRPQADPFLSTLMSTSQEERQSQQGSATTTTCSEPAQKKPRAPRKKQSGQKKTQADPSTGVTARWRIHAKSLFLTYPQCQASKEEVQRNLQESFKGHLQWYLIAEEKHEDGSPHVHIGLETKEQMNYTDQAKLDKLVVSSSHPEGKHGNYQAMRNKRNTVIYLTNPYNKKTGTYLSEGIDIDSVIGKQGFKTDELVKMLKEGAKPEEIMDAFPSLYLKNYRSIHQIAGDVASLRQCSRTLPKIVSIQIKSTSPSNTSAASMLEEWLNSNLSRDKQPRKPRQQQMYIWGPPAIGKSTLVNKLKEFLRVYEIPYEEWNDNYLDGAFDLMIADEFKAQKAIYEMNLLSDGNVTPLKRRGKPPYLKGDKLPLIICSNFSPSEAYKKADEMSRRAFCSRYTEVYLDDLFTVKITTE